jgi:acetyltransferase-like isoleucine patch superfamily enzyme
MPSSDTPIVLIAFENSSLVKDIKHFISASTQRKIQILCPHVFMAQGSSQAYSHLICVNKDMNLREQVVTKVNRGGYKKYTHIDPNAVIAEDSKIGDGCFLAPFVTVASDTIIKDDCIISPYCLVSHRSVLGVGCVMQPYSMIAGTSVIGNFCKLNIKSATIDHVVLSDHVELGSGALVTKNIEVPGFYLGSPARKKIFHTSDNNKICDVGPHRV